MNKREIEEKLKDLINKKTLIEERLASLRNSIEDKEILEIFDLYDLLYDINDDIKKLLDLKKEVAEKDDYEI